MSSSHGSWDGHLPGSPSVVSSCNKGIGEKEILASWIAQVGTRSQVPRILQEMINKWWNVHIYVILRQDTILR